MSVTLTESAATRVKSHLQSHTEVTGLRFSIKRSGCSGLAYVLDYADETGDGDRVFESRGVRVIINDEHLSFLNGTEIDYHQEGLSAEFQFKNPNVVEKCGCGESFTAG